MSKNQNQQSSNTHEVILRQSIYQLKIILVGDSSVGKTTLVNRYMGYEFNENYSCTINADFKIKSLSITPNIGAELTIWDTCGQERFKSLTRQYFKDAHGVILVYDVGDLNSFNNVSSWLKEIKTCSNLNPDIALVANKIDLENRKVSKETGTKFAEKNGLIYIETSSKEGINIDTPFEKLAKSLVEKIQSNPNLNNNNDDDYIKNYGIKNELEKNREKDIKCC
jgi:Ras-related protein Rab-18